MSINGTNVRGYDRSGFRDVLSALPAGPVNIVVSDAFKRMIANGNIVTATATKAEADSKLGFTYKVMKHRITVETVKEDGIFAGKLKSGFEIMRINSSSVAGLDRNEFRALLSALPAGDVKIDAYVKPEKASPSASTVAPPVLTKADQDEEDAEEEDFIYENEDGEDKDAEDKPSAGSSLAAMGAASALATGMTKSGRPMEEVRTEVAGLAARANPGKSVDELMKQYEGREEELITHLKKFLEKSGK